MTANVFSRIAELWPRNQLYYGECRELCELIDRNHAENGLTGRDRERFDALIEQAERHEHQRPIRMSDYF